MVNNETITDFTFKRNKGKYELTLEIFEDVGKALLISILDLQNLNPVSRVKTSPFLTLDVNSSVSSPKYFSLEIKIAYGLFCH